MASRIAHHIGFPACAMDERLRISELMLEKMHYRLSADPSPVFRDYITRRMEQPRLSNARSIRNALDRARLRQANRLLAGRETPFHRDALEVGEADGMRPSRVFAQ